MSSKPRVKIPPTLRMVLFYESAWKCVICQARGTHIHHIDQDHSNNNPSNLVVLCMSHHDEAHTKHDLSQNLTPQYIINAKHTWTQQVYANREKIASLAGQKENSDPFFRVGIAWGYINHKRITQLLNDSILQNVNQSIFGTCKSRGLVDDHGIIISPPNWQAGPEAINNTIYDRFEFGDDHRIHALYSEFVDQISTQVAPLHLTNHNWNKSFVSEILSSGDFIFFIKGTYFKIIKQTEKNIHARALAIGNKVKIEYYVDSIDMFGTTSITVSFRGHSTCSALLQIKSIESTEDSTHIHCTPIALGVGFQGSAF